MADERREGVDVWTLPFAAHVEHAYTPRETGPYGGRNHVVVDEEIAVGRLGREAAVRLRGEGLSYAQIGRALGVSKSTARRWVNPEVAARERAARRAWDWRYREWNGRRRDAWRARCQECGRPMGAGSGDPSRRAARCEHCRRVRGRRRVRARRRVIASGWQAGASLVEIAARVGSTASSIGAEVSRMRRDGWTLEYRNEAYRRGRGRRVEVRRERQ